MNKTELVTWSIKAVFNGADIDEANAYCEEHNIKMEYRGEEGTMYFTWSKEEIEKIKTLFEDME